MTQTFYGLTITVTDHTVETPAGILAGFIVRTPSRTLGYVWPQFGAWQWRSESGRAFGERQKKAVAIDALVQAYAWHAAGQRGLPFSGDGLIGQAKASIRQGARLQDERRARMAEARSTPYTAAPEKSVPTASPEVVAATPKVHRQEINWGAGVSVNSDAVAAAFKKQGSK